MLDWQTAFAERCETLSKFLDRDLTEEELYNEAEEAVNDVVEAAAVEAEWDRRVWEERA